MADPDGPTCTDGGNEFPVNTHRCINNKCMRCDASADGKTASWVATGHGCVQGQENCTPPDDDSK